MSQLLRTFAWSIYLTIAQQILLNTHSALHKLSVLMENTAWKQDTRGLSSTGVLVTCPSSFLIFFVLLFFFFFFLLISLTSKVFFLFFPIEIQLIYNTILVSGVQQSDSCNIFT